MKKFTTSILAFLACAACLTGCLAPDDSSSTGGGNSGDNAAVTAAAAALKAKYDTELEDGRTDYEVSNVWGDYDVAWTVSFADGTNAVNLFDEGDFTTVEINKLLASDVDYTLKATLTAADGTSASTNIVRTAFAIDQNISAPIGADPVVGTAYKLHMHNPEISASKGPDRYFKGSMGTGGNQYYFATADNVDNGVDVYVEANEATADVDDDFYMYFLDGTAHKYLSVYLSGKYKNDRIDTEKANASVWTYNAEVGTMTTTLNYKGDNDAEAVDHVMYLGAYSTIDTLRPVAFDEHPDNYKACLTSVMPRADVADSVRVNSTLTEVAIDPVVVGEYTMKLPLLGEVYPEASIAWEVTKGAEAVSLNTRGNRLTTKTVTALTEVTLKATVTAGDVTKTKEITLNVAPNTVDGIFAATEKLSSGTYFANEVSLTGTVTTDLPIELSDKWPNLNESITIEVAEGKKINAYNLAGAGYDVIKPGYTVTVKGIITNYSGTIQFNRGCEIVSYAAPTADQTKVDVEKALFEMETSVTKNGTVALPTAGTTYSDVAIAWSVVTEGTTGTYELAQDGKSITFTRSESEATVVNLKATFTCGEGTATKDFAMNLTKAGSVTATFEDVLYSTENDDTFDEPITVEGVTITCDKGTGDLSKHYSNRLRWYKGNALTFTVADDCVIKSIKIVSESDKTINNLTKCTIASVTDVAGTDGVAIPTTAYTTDLTVVDQYVINFTGELNKVTLTNNSQTRIISIEVVYAEK